MFMCVQMLFVDYGVLFFGASGLWAERIFTGDDTL